MSETSRRKPAAMLFGVGVGPGDPELLTLKAIRVIQAASVIAVPCAIADGDSYALQIVKGLLHPEQSIITLHFPMVRDVIERQRHRERAAETVVAHLEEGRDVAFLTEGDPLLYSTFAHLLAYLPAATPIEIVPGVTSIHAAAAQVRLPLVQGDQRMAILPATGENMERLPAILEQFDTVVLLKFRCTFEQVVRVLDDLHLTENAVLIDRASHPAGRVVRDVRSVQESEVHYLSLMIISNTREVQDAD